jgi:hypothetical protein
MYRKLITLGLVLGLLMLFGTGTAYAGHVQPPDPVLLTSALGGGVSGSTIGPDGALYVASSATGTISRVDPEDGSTTIFATGLPLPVLPIGGAFDVAFLEGTAYALVTMVGSDVGGNSDVGIYRIDGPSSHSLVADIGAFSVANPPYTEFFIPTGVQYAFEPYRGGFLVTDGHHNRVLWASLDGEIMELIAFGNTVPTGLETWGNKVLVAHSGPVPHLPEDGKLLAFEFGSTIAHELASGARLVVDVEFGLGRTLYLLSQGYHAGGPDGSPAEPNTGALMELAADGALVPVAEGLNQPTSLEFIGSNAYIVTLNGEVWKIFDVSEPPYGVPR